MADGGKRSATQSHIVIAIDGPSGAGKSTAAQRLACWLGYRYVDSGAMYRTVGWIAQQHGVTLHDPDGVAHFLAQRCIALTFQDGVPEVWVDGQHVTPYLQGEVVGKMASFVATLLPVRQFITAKLRRYRGDGPLVMEGRDIGTVVFPDASIKFFLDAAVEQRGRRRFQEMQQEGFVGTLEDVMQAVIARDEQDRRRTAAPLQCASDAYMIDTTDLAIDDVVQTMLSHIQSNIPTV